MFLQSNAEYRLFRAGRGAGKSYAGSLLCLMQPPNTTGIVMAPTYGMLRDGAMKIILDIAQRAGIVVDWNKTEGELVLLGNRIIKFRSVDNVNRIRGNSVGWLYFDEMCYMNPEVWTVALGARRQNPMKVWATTTPNGKDFVYHIWNTDDPAFEIFGSSSADNIFAPKGFVTSLRSQMTEEQWRQEGLGEIIDPSGTMFNRAWFKYAEEHEIPKKLSWYRYWDLAMTTRASSDFTASAKVAIDEQGTMYVGDIIQIKAEYPEVRKLIIETALQEPDVIVGIEEAVSGYAAIQEIRRVPELSSTTIRGVSVDKDKMSRAMPWASRAESGQVKLKYAKWNRMFLDEVTFFPKGEHDDMVDAVSGALQMISKRKIDWVVL
jgi:predicted phage terminase large subunit-like protein